MVKVHARCLSSHAPCMHFYHSQVLLSNGGRPNSCYFPPERPCTVNDEPFFGVNDAAYW